MKVESVRSTHM